MTLPGFDDAQLIGRGGTADVYRATRAHDGAVVAVKIPRDTIAGARRCRRESKALLMLAHSSHVVEFHNRLELPSGPALVLEYAARGSVAHVFVQGSASTYELCVVGLHASRALADLHDCGVVHRDVKPHNLLVDHVGTVKLSDFGAGLIAGESPTHVRSTWSTRYASPEDLEPDGPAPRSSTDVYSLGATLLHLAHSAPPSVRDRIDGWQPPPTSAIDPRLDRLIQTCLDLDESARPTAEQLVRDFERLLVGFDSPAVLHRQPSRDRPVTLSDVETLEPSAATPLTSTEKPTQATKRSWSVVRTATTAVLVLVTTALAAFAPTALRSASRGHQAVDTSDGAGWMPSLDRGLSPTSDATLAGRRGRFGALGDTHWSSLDVGACVTNPAGSARLVEVSCALPHDAQVVAGFEAGAAAEGFSATSMCDAGLDRVVAQRSVGGVMVEVVTVEDRDLALSLCVAHVPGHHLAGSLLDHD